MSIKKGIYITIVIQALLIILLYTRQGSFYYWDMFYSFRTINYASASTPNSHNIVSDPKFEEHKWLDTSFARDILTVDYEDSVLCDPLPVVLKNICKQPYWIIMNIVEAIFTPGEISGWPGIMFNVIFFILTQVTLFKMVYRLSSDYERALVALLIYGFCGMTMSIATYVRFYVFSCFLCVAFTYLHVLIWDVEYKKWYRIFILEMMALVCAWWSVNISQFSLFYVTFFIIFFAIALLACKKYKEFLIYFMPMLLGGGLFLSTQPTYVEMLLNPAKAYANIPEYSSARWVLEMLLTLTPKTFAERALHEILLIGKYGFGYWPVLFLLLGLLVFYLLRQKNFDLFKCPMEWVMFGTMTGFIIVATALRFYTEARYSTQVFPLIAWFAATILISLKKIFDNRRIVYCFVVVVVGAIVISVISGQRVVYVSSAGQDIVEFIEDKKVQNTVITYWGDSGPSYDIIYQTISLLDDSSKFLVAETYEAIEEDLPNELLYVTRDINDYVDDFVNKGYVIEWKSEASVYTFYYLCKNK